MARDNLAILWLLATHAGFIIALTLILGAPPFDPLKADQNRLSFFDLPAELRNRIYQFALTEPCNFGFCYLDRPGGAILRLNTASVLPSILLACHAAYAEANPILYGANKFSFKAPQMAILFLDQIGRSIDLVRHIEIKEDDYSAYIAAFKFALSLSTPSDEFEDRVAQWEITMAFQELFKEGNRDFGKQEVWARVKSRLDRQYGWQDKLDRYEKLLA